MIKLLGILDIIASAFLFFSVLNIYFPKQMGIVIAIYLILKGIIFITSLVSIIDVLSGIMLLAGFYFIIPRVIVIVIAILLLQKGIFSLLSH